MTDLDALQTMLLDEFARIHDRLNTIEHKLGLIPNLNLLLTGACSARFKTAEINQSQSLDRLPVPAGLPGRPRGRDWRRLNCRRTSSKPRSSITLPTCGTAPPVRPSRRGCRQAD
jgi:hypothetical protein